jgi:hypothetical protein
MFDLVDRPLVWIPVKWEAVAPGPDDGLAVTVEVEVHILVELIDRKEFKRLFLSEDDAPESDIIERVVRNWRKVTERGAAVPYSPEKMAVLLEAPGFAKAFGDSYVAAMAGRGETREKNSESSPNNGRAEGTQSEAQPTTTPSTASANGSA